MRVLFLAAEAVPYVKVGGLGDVAGALPEALRQLGHDVRLMMPRFGLIDAAKYGLTKVRDNFPVTMDWRTEYCQLWRNPKTNDSFIENDYFFGSRFQVYGCGDEVEQFVLFCRAALEACRLEGWIPDVVHAHDWHTAAAIRLEWAAPNRPGLVFTIHNMAHQGNQHPQGWPLLGVYNGQGGMNLMQQALNCADYITTVSPTYAQEIKRPDYGFGLDWQLREKGNRLVGVLNGLDIQSYDPAKDTKIAANYTFNTIEKKHHCKRELQSLMNIIPNEAPLIGMVTRLDFQKGVDLVVRALDDIVNYSEANVVILGSGDQSLEGSLKYLASRYTQRVSAYIGFDPMLARKVYAGSDIFLMPSNFEPCGLSQMIAMRYGTIPVARATGGLVDTITDCRSDSNNGTGYLFGPYNHHEMLGALGAAINDFSTDTSKWRAMQQRAMNQDFSWKRAAEQYAEIYKKAQNRV